MRRYGNFNASRFHHHHIWFISMPGIVAHYITAAGMKATRKTTAGKAFHRSRGNLECESFIVGRSFIAHSRTAFRLRIVAERITFRYGACRMNEVTMAIRRQLENYFCTATASLNDEHPVFSIPRRRRRH